jgi:Zn-finger nucleic acid-binding protein
MSCPTCDHTLQTVMMDRVRKLWHCPRCGTMVSVLLGHTDVVVPKLVARQRDFIRLIEPAELERWLRANKERLAEGMGANLARFFREALHQSGVTESVLPPDERPKGG